MTSRPETPTGHAEPLTPLARWERLSEPGALTAPIAIGCTLLLAIFLGTWAASGQVENLILAFVWMVTIGIIVFIQDHWWSPALIITAMSFQTVAFGVPLTGMELGMVILALTFPVKVAMKTLRRAEPEINPGILYWLLFGYVCVHAVIILGYSHIEGTPPKNVIKAYYSTITPLLLYGMLLRYCHARTVRPAVIAIFVATFVSVSVSIFTTILMIDVRPFSDLRITIGWLDPTGALGILRYSAIFLFIGGIAFWPTVLSFWGKVFVGGTILMSAFGVLLSGGRLSVATCIGGALFFAAVRRRIWLALPALLFTTVVAGVITLKPDILFSLPETVQRGLAPLNFSDKQTDVQVGLEASDNWHHDLRVESLDYWTTDTISFLLGHGFKGYDDSLLGAATDPLDADPGDYERMKVAAVQMGRTENTFSCLTNIFGLTGFILYTVFLLDLAWKLWKAARICPEHSTARALCEFSLVNLAAFLLLIPFLGGTPGINLIYWQLGLLAARPFLGAANPSGKERQPLPLPLFIPKSLRPV